MAYAQSARIWNFRPAGEVCDRERHVLWVSCSLNEGIQPHGRWEISLLPSDWPVFGRGGRGRASGQGGVMWPNLAEHSIMGPPLTAGRERERERERENGLDENQKKPSTTHRLCIVAYSLDSISGHFIIQLGQLSHHTAEKRALQSNWKLHAATGGHTEETHSPLSIFISLSLSLLLLLFFLDFVRKREGGRVKERKKASNRGH